MAEGFINDKKYRVGDKNITIAQAHLTKIKNPKWSSLTRDFLVIIIPSLYKYHS